MSATSLSSDRPDFTLYLGRDGDSIEVKNFFNTEATKTPLILEAESCKTHEAVLEVLNKLNCSNEREAFSFYHRHNNDYEGHKGFKGFAHPCTLETQITFVQQKISELGQVSDSSGFLAKVCHIKKKK